MGIKRLFNNVKFQKGLVLSLSVLFLSICEYIGFAITKNTSPYLYDQFLNTLVSTMKDGKDVFSRTILSVSNSDIATKKQYVFRDLMASSSADGNFGDFRTVINEKFKWNDFDLHLETQSNFYTSYAEDDYGYKYIHIDYDTYSPYFLDSELINRRVGNHDSFILISDTFARKLIDYYNLDDGVSSEKDLFKKLVLDDTKGAIVVSSGDTTLDFRITNIIRTDYLHGVRTNQIYGDFGVFYISNNIDSTKLSFNFEIDLKNNATCLKNTFSFLNQHEYSPSIYPYSFKVMSDGVYHDDSSLRNQFYRSIINNDKTATNNIICISYSFLVAFIFLLTIYFLCKKIPFVCLYSFYGCLITFSIYGILACFINVYPLLSILPVLCIVESFVLSFEEIKNVFKTFVSKNKKQS